MNDYLIPANSKKGQLIFNVFRWEDLLILGGGALITFILFFTGLGESLWGMALVLIPVGVAVVLVYPVKYYHNVLVFIREMYQYFISQNQYRWKGWCISSGKDEE